MPIIYRKTRKTKLEKLVRRGVGDVNLGGVGDDQGLGGKKRQGEVRWQYRE